MTVFYTAGDRFLNNSCYRVKKKVLSVFPPVFEGNSRGELAKRSVLEGEISRGRMLGGVLCYAWSNFYQSYL